MNYLLKVHESFPGYQRHVTTMNVDIDGDEAHAESYFLSVICPEQSDQKLMVAAGRYIDRLERRDGEWKIATRVVVLEWQGSMEGGAIRAANAPPPRPRRRVVRAPAGGHPQRPRPVRPPLSASTRASDDARSRRRNESTTSSNSSLRSIIAQ